MSEAVTIGTAIILAILGFSVATFGLLVAITIKPRRGNKPQ